MEEALERGKEAIEKAQYKKERDINIHWRIPDFDVGDEVWVTRKGWRTLRPSKKLDNQNEGPFKILKKVGHSYQLKLPDSVKVHDVFYADRLRKAADDPLPGQRNPEPGPVYITDDAEYEVGKILAVKLSRGKLLYQASWVGYNKDLNFYPASDFKYSPHKLHDFHTEYPQQPGPPYRLVD